ncbi:catechol 2,3-dioxygenase-like lactoylglutathione lyase family enzyme [Bradyrhizobium sp. F1.13.1]
MLGRLNHVAIATKDAVKAARIYGAAFGAQISEAVALPEHGVTTVFATLPNVTPRSSSSSRSARPRRSQSSSTATPTAASTTSVTRWSTSSPRATRW